MRRRCAALSTSPHSLIPASHFGPLDTALSLTYSCTHPTLIPAVPPPPPPFTAPTDSQFQSIFSVAYDPYDGFGDARRLQRIQDPSLPPSLTMPPFHQTCRLSVPEHILRGVRPLQPGAHEWRAGRACHHLVTRWTHPAPVSVVVGCQSQRGSSTVGLGDCFFWVV
jgi:hypothetical protein